MNVSATSIAGLLIIEPSRHGDARGFFSEVFRQDLFRRDAADVAFVQDNHSFTALKGTIRGLHAQRPPRAQGKLVRVVRGGILDVAVDVRAGSTTYARHVAVELSAENWRQLWIPPGFLHGFCALTDDVEMIYKVTDYYSPADDVGVAHDDPDIGIAWPALGEPNLSARDRAAPRLAALGPLFPAVMSGG